MAGVTLTTFAPAMKERYARPSRVVSRMLPKLLRMKVKKGKTVHHKVGHTVHKQRIPREV